MDRSGAFLFFFCRKITFKDRLTARAKCTGMCCLPAAASAMDTTRPCLTPIALGLIRCSTNIQYVCTSHLQVNSYYSFVGSRTRTIILPLGTYLAWLLYSEHLPGVSHCPNCVHTAFTLTCESHVIF